MNNSRTIKNEIYMEGVGLHSGIKSKLTLIPYENCGINFKTKNGVFGISSAVVEEDSRLTGFRLPDGTVVRTAEHLLASLVGMSVNSVLICLEGEEVPILDGSAHEFALAVDSVGYSELPCECVKKSVNSPVCIEDEAGGRFISAAPSSKTRVTYVIDYSGTPIGVQKVSYDINEDVFLNTISRARTFGLTYELEYLKKANLARGGSLDNALVFDGESLLNEGGLRFPLECVTHKVIDLLGDLALLGYLPTASYTAICAGHGVHGKLVEKLKRVIPPIV
ncbi:MAG: UDP-3-O-acyl-N-acetylglucosamine deacetylase [Synergistaceae bacterium]